MHKNWRFIPSLKAFAVTLIAGAALALNIQGAFAQQMDEQDVNTKTYMLDAGGAWTAAQDAAVQSAGGTVKFKHAPAGIAAVSSSDAAFMRKMQKSGKFANVAEDVVVQWQDPRDTQQVMDEDEVEALVTPNNETFINLQWNMTAIDAFGAWNAGYDGTGVRVAVIDGGGCPLNADLSARYDVPRCASFVPGFTWDQDAGGASTFRHACHVAGIIAASDNSFGTIGVAPKATIINVKALHNGSGSFAQVIAAILYAADPIADGGAGAEIINMSLGATFARGGGNTGAGALVAALNKAVNYATSKNVLVVSSAGNSALDLDHTGSLITVPAQSGSGIAVSATAPVGFAVGWPNGATNFRNFTTYSNYGHSLVNLAAPGGDTALPGNAICSIPRVPSGSVTTVCWIFDAILSPAAQTNSFFFAAGTSMAAPHVSGVAALVKQKYPGISVGDLKTHLQNTADDEGATGADPFYGHGFVNAFRAVTEPLSVTSPSGSDLSAVTIPDGVDLAVGKTAVGSKPQVSFTLRKAGQVRVDLFDLSGRNVASLYNGNANAGVTTIAWNGRGRGQDLPSGAYFVRVNAGAASASKMILFTK